MPRSLRARALLVLSLAQAGAMLIWYNFSAVLPLVQREWNLSGGEAGGILAAFQAGYVAAVLFTSWLADRYGGRLVFAVSAAATGVAGVGFSLLAHDYISGLVWRALAGLGQGGLYIPGIIVLSRCFPGEERGKAIGIYTCSMVGAYAASYLVTGPLAAAYSWRMALLWTSIWAFPAAILAYYGIPQAVRTAAAQPEQGVRTAAPSGIWTLARNLPAWVIIGGYMGHMWELYAFWGWVGAYFTHVFANSGMTESQAVNAGGLLSAASILTGGVAPGLAGWISDRAGRTVTAVVTLTVSGLCSFSFGWTAGLPPAISVTIGIIYGFFVVADSALFKAGLTEMVPAADQGLALGIQSVLGFGVTIISTKLLGVVLDRAGWGWAFATLGFGAVFGIACMLYLRTLPASALMAGGKK